MLRLAVLAAVGVAAGYLNAISGAGSLITLPALVFTGLDASAANATNRIAILFQNASTLAGYSSGGLRTAGPTLWLLLPAGAGSALGAYVASLLSADSIGVAIALAMVVMLALSFVRAPQSAALDHPRVSAGMVAGFFGIGVYAGFIQAGAGVMILLFLSLAYGINLVIANLLKNVALLAISAIAIAVFALRGLHLDVVRGTVLAASMSAGGFVGARATIKRGEGFIRLMVVIAVTLSAAKLLYDALTGGSGE